MKISNSVKYSNSRSRSMKISNNNSKRKSSHSVKCNSKAAA